MPRHRLHDDPSRGQRQIALEGWTITTTKKPILSIPEADAQVSHIPRITFPSKELTRPPTAPQTNSTSPSPKSASETTRSESCTTRPVSPSSGTRSTRSAPSSAARGGTLAPVPVQSGSRTPTSGLARQFRSSSSVIRFAESDCPLAYLQPNRNRLFDQSDRAKTVRLDLYHSPSRFNLHLRFEYRRTPPRVATSTSHASGNPARVVGADRHPHLVL